MNLRGIVAPLGLGIIIREIVAPFTGHPFDFELWLRLGYYVSKGGNPYTYTSPIPGLSMPSAGIMTWIGYPPIWAFFQAGLYTIYSFIQVNNRFLYYFIVKQPMILADILCAYLLLKILDSQMNKETGLKAFRFWLLCPFTIIISAVWGMFDQIALLLVLTAVLLVTQTRESALIEALAFLLKVIPLIYLPILAFAQRSTTRIAAYVYMMVGASVFFALLPFLFFPSWNVASLYGVGVDVTNKIGNSMNYWTIVYVASQSPSFPATTFSILKVLAYIWVPAILLGSYYCIRIVRRSLDDEILLARSLLMGFLFITLIFFLTKSTINEQYAIYFLGFGLVDYYYFNSKTRKILFHAIWIAALVFLIVNNGYLVRFLVPLSTSYANLELTFLQGTLGSLRFDLLEASGILFTVLCFIYLRSLYLEMKATTFRNRSPAPNNATVRARMK